MKRTNLLIALPLVVLMASCEAIDYSPFNDDKYEPVGFETEDIVRQLSAEETNVFNTGMDFVDNYTTSEKITTEERNFSWSYFDSNGPDGLDTSDYSISSTVENKLYNNNVRVRKVQESISTLSHYLDANVITTRVDWIYNPSPTTYEHRHSLILNGDVEKVTIADSGAYDETMYDDIFAISPPSTLDVFTDPYIGMNADEDIILIQFESESEHLPLARNTSVVYTTSVVYEAKFKLYEPEDDTAPFYRPILFRTFEQNRVASEEFQPGEEIVYFDKPVILGYSETIYAWDVLPKTAFSLNEIPDLTE
ncbi:MAG: hypothetical protein WC282_03015 [Bacilli bacterium]|jgi:hypothetical protein